MIHGADAIDGTEDLTDGIVGITGTDGTALATPIDGTDGTVGTEDSTTEDGIEDSTTALVDSATSDQVDLWQISMPSTIATLIARQQDLAEAGVSIRSDLELPIAPQTTSTHL